MKNLLSILLLTFISSGSFAQSYWKHFDTSDGLISNNVKCVAIENNNSIYLGTGTGLSHYNQGTFTNYTKANSGLNSDSIIEIKLSNNTLFLLTDSGVSTFDGINFTNYTVRDGLPSGKIRDIQLTSTGTLWVGNDSGVVSFNGTQFTQYPGKTALAIGVDSADQVYIITKLAAMASDTTTKNLEIFDGNNWSSHSIKIQDSLVYFIFAKFRLLNNNQLIILANTTNGYEVMSVKNDVFTLIPFEYEKKRIGFYSTDLIQVDQNNNFWLSYLSNFQYWSSIHSGSPLNLIKHNFNQYYFKPSDIEIYNDQVIFSNEYGFYMANTDVKPIKTNYNFDVNTISTTVSSAGFLFNNYDGPASFEFPKGSGLHAVYSGNFLVSAKKSTNTTFNAHPIDYFALDYFSGPKNNRNEVTRTFMAKVSKTEITNHIAQYNAQGYQIPEGILNWPAIGDSTLDEPFDLAPFIDVNLNGCYDPANGDYPVIKGDEAIYWINRPNDTSALSDLEYHNMIYGFNNPTDLLINQSIFLERTIVNRANVAYDSIKVGFHMDHDVGMASDDYSGCDSLNNVFYGYNGDSYDQNGYGINPPAIGIKFLSDSMDNYVYSKGGSSNNGGIQTESDVHNFLNARWKDGSSILYGGDGYRAPGTTTIPTKYMFSGDPVAGIGWTEGNLGNPVGARNGMAAIPYFSLQPNERKTITIAVGYGFDSISSGAPHLNAITAMINSLNHAKTVYNNMQPNNGVVATNYNCPIIKVSIDEAKISAEDFNIYPVPTSGAFTIESDAQIDRIEVIDIRGVRVSEHTPSSQSNLIDINLPSTINNGLYVVRIQLENQQWISKKIMLSK